MDQSRIINFNGTLVNEQSFSLPITNRAFKYGDGVFETIKTIKNKILFAEEHFNRLIKGAKILEISTPKHFNYTYFCEEIIKTVEANKNFPSARVRFSLFRKDGNGFYSPQFNDSNFTIETNTLHDQNFTLNNKGFKIEIYDKIPKPINILSNLKTINCLNFVLAGVYKNKIGADECILINDYGNLVESISSNLFIVKENIIYTPSLDEGCIEGIMRDVIIDIALKKKFKVYDCALAPKDLLNADEIFLTNSISGINWVIAYKNKRFFNKISKEFLTELNKITDII